MPVEMCDLYVIATIGVVALNEADVIQGGQRGVEMLERTRRRREDKVADREHVAWEAPEVVGVRDDKWE